MNYRYTPEEIAEALGRPAPTPEQSAIISSPLAPRLVVAGAGSGKTATMVDRVVFLVANGLVRADQVLGVTFTRKAAGELRERMRLRLEELRRLGMVAQPAGEEAAPVVDPSVSTYHSYANYLVTNYGLRLGVEQDSQMLGGAQAWQLVAQLVEYVDPRLIPADPQAKQSMIDAVLKLAGECAEHLRDPQDVIDWCQREITVLENLPLAGRNRGADRNKLVDRLKNRIFYAQLVQMYATVKKNMQVMDYGDLIALAAKIARTIPQARQTERDRYRVVLLDEFQDTSHAQMELFSDLFGAVKGRSEHPVMAVGDPKQSIYGFRGASDGQLLNFYNYFPTADTTASYLTVAWRNDTQILEAANTVAKPLQEQPDWVEVRTQVQVPDLAPRPEPGTGTVRLERFETDAQEAVALAQTVSAERGRYAGRPLSEMPTMAVLCKKRSQMEPIARAFDELAVPCQIVGLGGLLDTPEVIDVVSTLRVLADPGRSDALMRLLAGARWRLGVSDLLAFSDWAAHLERRRRQSIRTGLAEDLYAEMTEEEAREEMERLAKQTTSDITDGASLIEALENLPEPGWTSFQGRSLTNEGLARLNMLAEELGQLREFMADDLTVLIAAIEQKTLLDIELAAKPGLPTSLARKNIDAFYDFAAQYSLSAPRINATLLAGAELVSADPEAEESEDGDRPLRFTLSASSGSASGVNGFLAWLDAAAAEEKGLDMVADEPRHDAVQILTVHASKGLEWDQVFIPGMNQGDFPRTDDPRWTQNSDTLPWPLRGDSGFLPTWRSDFENVVELKDFLNQLKEEAQLYRINEERRLAYVGITRARSLLVLSNSAWQGTKSKPAAASDFWAELYEENGAGAAGSSSFALGYIFPEDQVGSENPQSESITTALWPFDPIDGPETFDWKSVESLNQAHDQGDFSDEAVEARRRASLLQEERLHTSRRARMERAAQNVLRGGLEEGFHAEQSPVIGAAETAGEDSGPSIDDWFHEADLLLSLLNAPSDTDDFELPSHLSASDLVALQTDTTAVVENIVRPMPQKPGIAARQGSLFHAWVESHFEKAAMLDFEEEDYADEAVDDSLNLPTLQENFLASPWAKLQPWAVEYPIETPVEGISIRGRVDAIYRSENERGEVLWEMVDWKTGRSPRTAAEKKAKSLQLALYRLGFARLMGVPVESVTGTFFYVAEKKVWQPEKLADEAELVRLIRRAQKIGRQRNRR
ncbi:ATP-dependent DNA helicase [Rothia aerolata]|uniref:DNA 3'-5' helicase n=1 Tax=Rothia aerolata TaxID=1812262 RepID=A0A917INI4_9MICC|nr:ATP-dependent DNA helicase [Rothia aerolata]GGH59737.1 ATP-dependent DNA helicase [Rothia aerolata]